MALAMVMTLYPAASRAAEMGDQEWWEGNADQQTAFLFDYFKNSIQGGAYSSDQVYSKNNNLYRAWRAADPEGKIEAAPPKARSFA